MPFLRLMKSRFSPARRGLFRAAELVPFFLVAARGGGVCLNETDLSFSKTGGIIYGDGSDDEVDEENKNTAYSGGAVAKLLYSNPVTHKVRDKTAGRGIDFNRDNFTYGLQYINQGQG